MKKKEYIQPTLKTHVVRVCQPLAASVQSTSGAVEMSEYEEFGAKQSVFNWESPGSVTNAGYDTDNDGYSDNGGW